MQPTDLFSRRQMLKTTACGFGYMAFASLAAQQAAAAAANPYCDVRDASAYGGARVDDGTAVATLTGVTGDDLRRARETLAAGGAVVGSPLLISNGMVTIAAVLPDLEDLVRREQTNYGVSRERTVLIGYAQGGTVALESVKAFPGLAGAVVAYSARFARLPRKGTRIDARIHLVHGGYDSVVSRVHAERAARVLAGLHVPVTLDVIEDLGHALTHEAICRGSLRLLQGIYEGRRATLH